MSPTCELEYPYVPQNITYMNVSGAIVLVHGDRGVECSPNYLLAYNLLSCACISVYAMYLAIYGKYLLARLLSLVGGHSKKMAVSTPMVVNLLLFAVCWLGMFYNVNLEQRRYQDGALSLVAQNLQVYGFILLR